jgi:putative protease
MTLGETMTWPAWENRMPDVPSAKEGTAMEEQKIGRVTHYFGHLGVAAIEITDGALSVGDTIHIKGHTSDFHQNVASIQVEHENVTAAKAGQNVGIKVVEHAREHDLVFKVIS